MNMTKKKRVQWEEFIGKTVDVHTHQTYQGLDMEVKGEVVAIRDIGREEFIVIKREDYAGEWLVNTHWIISFKVI